MFDQLYCHHQLEEDAIDVSWVHQAALVLYTRRNIPDLTEPIHIEEPVIDFDYRGEHYQLFVETASVGKDLLLSGILLAPHRLSGCPAVIGRINGRDINGLVHTPSEWHFGHLSYPDGVVSDTDREALNLEMQQRVTSQYMFGLLARKMWTVSV